MANPLYTNTMQYIMRQLGSPIINVEITEDQLEDQIDDALEEYHEEHFNGTFVGFLPLSLVEGETTYQLNDNIQTVTRIISTEGLNLSLSEDEPMLLKSFYLGNNNVSFNTPDIVDVEIFRQRFKLFEDYFDIPIQFNFNSATHTLHLFTEPTDDFNVFLHVYMYDEDQIEKYLSDRWVKRYATALSRRQWGRNLMKYDGASLPGGAQFNAAGIIEQAETDIEKLMEELEDKYSLPIDPQVG